MINYKLDCVRKTRNEAGWKLTYYYNYIPIMIESICNELYKC